MSFDDEFPWVPVSKSDAYDPLESNDIEVGDETPLVVTPRGGAREIGRSCYEVQTAESTILIDCGLNQGDGGEFPDFRGLESEDVDAVVLTHAHIDHCGGLPVLEAKGLLDDDANIYATRPTVQLAHTMLEDSLKLHKREAQSGSVSQRFTRSHVDAVYERFEPISHGTHKIEEFDYISTEEFGTFTIGPAGHLLGSVWVSIMSDGYRAVFSGDLGGRATHLPNIEQPPEAEALFIESTYGSTHTHRSMSDAKEEFFQSILSDIQNRRPVLIPTFAVGKAQTVLHKLSERLQQVSDTGEEFTIVLDGMAQEATDIYHSHVTSEDFVTDSIINPAKNSGLTTPFHPPNITQPERDEQREKILDKFSPSGDGPVPIVVSPSGMFSGGHSPRYLTEFTCRYNDFSVYLTGYQANGTPGNALQNAGEVADSGKVPLTLDTGPFGVDWPQTDAVAVTQTEGGNHVVKVEVPIKTINSVSGLSGHASRNHLLQFARDVSPETVGLIHGPDFAQVDLLDHFADNLPGAESITRTRMLTPIPITQSPDIPTPTKRYTERSSDDVKDQIEAMSDTLTTLSSEVAQVRNCSLDEDDVRAIVREELETLLSDD